MQLIMKRKFFFVFSSPDFAMCKEMTSLFYGGGLELVLSVVANEAKLKLQERYYLFYKIPNNELYWLLFLWLQTLKVSPSGFFFPLSFAFFSFMFLLWFSETESWLECCSPLCREIYFSYWYGSGPLFTSDALALCWSSYLLHFKGISGFNVSLRCMYILVTKNSEYASKLHGSITREGYFCSRAFWGLSGILYCRSLGNVTWKWANLVMLQSVVDLTRILKLQLTWYVGCADLNLLGRIWA